VLLVREEPGKKVLEIDHKEGRVINILTIVCPEEVDLRSSRRSMTVNSSTALKPYLMGLESRRNGYFVEGLL
jgi:hypothetical protein